MSAGSASGAGGKKKKVLSKAKILRAVEADDNLGFCVACGAEHGGIEPDARKYKCEECGELKVYGAEELLMMIVL